MKCNLVDRGSILQDCVAVSWWAGTGSLVMLGLYSAISTASEIWTGKQSAWTKKHLKTYVN